MIWLIVRGPLVDRGNCEIKGAGSGRSQMSSSASSEQLSRFIFRLLGIAFSTGLIRDVVYAAIRAIIHLSLSSVRAS